MSSRAPKTGLAGRMRRWMQAQGRHPFSKRDVYIGLGIDDPKARATVRSTMPDFVDRDEIILVPPTKRNRGQNLNFYRYNAAWSCEQKGSLKPRIFKAMYVSGTFAVTDIVRLCKEPDQEMERDWIDRIVRSLRRAKHISIVGRRLCAHGAGAESLYHITDRDRFRLQVMK
jgi:hypothetical protein